MQAKSIVGAIGALVGLAYCGGLVWYFVFHVSGGIEGANALGLGPTAIGLAAIGLAFGLWLIFKIARLTGTPPAAGAGPGRDPKTPDDPATAMDADAIIARYKASQAAAGASSQSAPMRSVAGAAPPSFGRRSR